MFETTVVESKKHKVGIQRYMTLPVSIALHVIVHSGRDGHHIVEAQFKAVARALRDATAHDPRTPGVPSTKGVL